ncbi:MAG: hypothetical protein IJ193_05380, partial [Bacilli bacterium]|nr:hypothetical protein [Bacilli bacterium]
LKQERVLNILKKYFGSDTFIDGTDLVNDMVYYYTSLTYPEGSKMIITDYNSESESYEVRFTGNKKTVDKFIENRKITSAKLKDNTITVVEKIVYYEKQEVDGKIYVQIYGDREKTNYLDEKVIKVKDSNKKKISVKDYYEQATTITHTFAYDEAGNDYYFVSSKIS